MAIYFFEADRGPNTVLVKGSIAAETRRVARDLLRLKGLEIRRLSEETATPFSSLSLLLRRSGKSRRVANHLIVSFIRELSTLLSVGVPLVEAIDSITRQHRGRMTAMLLSIRESISAGASLADAMRLHPTVFDDLCIGITEVGEDSGDLEGALERLAEFKDRSQQLKGRVTTALIYPCIVLFMAGAITVFLMTFVVPTILEPLIEMGRALPWPTRVVRGASDLLIGWGWLVGAIAVAIGIAVPLSLRARSVRRLFDRSLLGLPILGDMIRKQAVVRICVIMGALIGGGVVFVRALEMARRSTRNIVLREAMEQCEEAVVGGTNIADALERSQAFPTLVVQVFAVGQQSGQMERMLARLAKDYDQQVATGAQRLGSVVEPILIVILASIVLLIALSTMLPILEASDVLQ